MVPIGWMDTSASLDDLRAALAYQDDRFLAAIEEIRRRGPAAAPLIPDLAELIGDLGAVAVPNERAPGETEPDTDFVPRGKLALQALTGIGSEAAAYLLERYRSGENRGRWAGAIAAMGQPGLPAALAILREVEWVRGSLITNLRFYGAPLLTEAKYERLRELIDDGWRCSKEWEQVILELDRVLAES
jgi:hypothetical protein